MHQNYSQGRGRQRQQRTAFSGPVSEPGAAAARAVSEGAQERCWGEVGGD